MRNVKLEALWVCEKKKKKMRVRWFIHDNAFSFGLSPIAIVQSLFFFFKQNRQSCFIPFFLFLFSMLLFF